MTISTRQKAVRSIVAALISGDFSDREIDEISSALMRYDELGPQLGSALRDVVRRLAEPPKSDTVKQHRGDEAFQELFEYLKRSDISQRQLFGLLEKISPEAVRSLDRKKMTTAELVDRLLRDYPKETDQLVKELSGFARVKPKQDPYLELIGKRLDK